jgi:hypothetical protein
VRIVTFPIYAGQELNVSNPEFNFVKIESDFPVIVQIGSCQFTETKRASCNDVSTDDLIKVQDLRAGAPADQVPENRIRITAIQHQ